MLNTNGFVSLLKCIMIVTIIGKMFKYLQDIWHNSNISLDVSTLHTKIMNLKNAAPLSFAADIA